MIPGPLNVPTTSSRPSQPVTKKATTPDMRAFVFNYESTKNRIESVFNGAVLTGPVFDLVEKAKTIKGRVSQTVKEERGQNKTIKLFKQTFQATSDG